MPSTDIPIDIMGPRLLVHALSAHLAAPTGKTPQVLLVLFQDDPLEILYQARKKGVPPRGAIFPKRTVAVLPSLPYARMMTDMLIRYRVRVFVSVSDGPEDLDNAIEAAAEGRYYVSPCMLQALPHLQDLLLPHTRHELMTHVMTVRQSEVLLLAQQGLTNQEIAERLSLQLSTVKVHRWAAYRRLTEREARPDQPGLPFRFHGG